MIAITTEMSLIGYQSVGYWKWQMCVWIFECTWRYRNHRYDIWFNWKKVCSFYHYATTLLFNYCRTAASLSLSNNNIRNRICVISKPTALACIARKFEAVRKSCNIQKKIKELERPRPQLQTLQTTYCRFSIYVVYF